MTTSFGGDMGLAMRATLLLSIGLFAAACGPPQPEPPPAANAARMLDVRDAWVAPTPSGVDVSAGYITIVNGTNADDRLIAASSPRAARVEVHEMSMDGAVMRMRAVESLAAPAGETVTLAPGGQHLMFFGVTPPFAEGETVEITLTFAAAGEVVVQAPVRSAAR